MLCLLFNESGSTDKGSADKEYFDQNPFASSHADMVGGGETGLPVEGTATAKALQWSHALLFRESLDHGASYWCIAS